MASAGAAAPLNRFVKLLPRSSAVRFFRRDGDDCFTVFERDAFDIADLVRLLDRSRPTPSVMTKLQNMRVSKP